MKFEKMTVATLREKCRGLGLPVYQCKGKRLLKADLVEQLRQSTSATYDVAPAPKTTEPAYRIEARKLTDDERLTIQLAKMTPSPSEQRALYHFLAVKPEHISPNQNHILRRREAKACQILATEARTSKIKEKWTLRHLQAIGHVI